MTEFSKIIIIFNPKSSGDSKKLAYELRKKLRADMPLTKTVCLPTKYAGHARILARDSARSCPIPLIISSSGDGGYNEVINGVIDSGNPKAVAAVLPAGNANDHSHAVQKRPLEEAIIKKVVRRLDLIKVTTKKAAEDPIVRYAHSYVGLGLTPNVATELAEYKKHFVKEILQIAKLLRQSHSFKIEHRGKVLDLENLLFTNTYLMAKILTFAPKTLPNDGMFEVMISPSKHKLQLAKRIVKAAVAKPKPEKVHSLPAYKFKTLSDTLMQMDGEIFEVSAGNSVTVESMHRALATVI